MHMFAKIEKFEIGDRVLITEGIQRGFTATVIEHQYKKMTAKGKCYILSDRGETILKYVHFLKKIEVEVIDG